MSGRVDLRELLARSDLAGLLGELSGEPIGAGYHARWHCPDRDHPDEHPSVTMFVDRHGVERWRCWSGGHQGTAIDAVMAARRVPVIDAIRYLEQRTGHAALRPTLRPRPRPARDVAPTEPSPALLAWVDAAAQRLWTPAGARALAALRVRTISDEVIAANRLGAHPPTDRRNGLPRYAGITIPSYGPGGELVFAQSRNLDPAAPSKYTNPRPRHAAVPAVTFPRGGRAGGPLVVTEGVLDGLVATTAGYRAAAVISASMPVTSRTVTAIAAHAGDEQVVVAFDGDREGRQASARLTVALREAGLTVRELTLPDGQDLTTLSQQHGPQHQLMHDQPAAVLTR